MASKKPSGLGRGLGALLGDDVMKTESSGSLSLPISQVETCSSQPRKRFDDESLQELADSISQHGIIQPLTVRKLSSGYYQIIAGERRWRAARLAGLQEVPVIVIEADDRKAAELAMIENLQREDLNPMEEAAGFQSLIESYHMTQEEAAQRVGKSRSAVTNALRLLGLTPSVPLDGAAGGLYQSGDGPQGGRFACAVGADQRHDPAVRYFQRNTPESLNAAVVDLEVFNFKHRPPPPDTRR